MELRRPSFEEYKPRRRSSRIMLSEGAMTENADVDDVQIQIPTQRGMLKSLPSPCLVHKSPGHIFDFSNTPLSIDTSQTDVFYNSPTSDISPHSSLKTVEEDEHIKDGTFDSRNDKNKTDNLRTFSDLIISPISSRQTSVDSPTYDEVISGTSSPLHSPPPSFPSPTPAFSPKDNNSMSPTYSKSSTSYSHIPASPSGYASQLKEGSNEIKTIHSTLSHSTNSGSNKKNESRDTQTVGRKSKFMSRFAMKHFMSSDGSKNTEGKKNPDSGYLLANNHITTHNAKSDIGSVDQSSALTPENRLDLNTNNMKETNDPETRPQQSFSDVNINNNTVILSSDRIDDCDKNKGVPLEIPRKNMGTHLIAVPSQQCLKEKTLSDTTPSVLSTPVSQPSEIIHESHLNQISNTEKNTSVGDKIHYRLDTMDDTNNPSPGHPKKIEEKSCHQQSYPDKYQQKSNDSLKSIDSLDRHSTESARQEIKRHQYTATPLFLNTDNSSHFCSEESPISSPYDEIPSKKKELQPENVPTLFRAQRCEVINPSTVDPCYAPTTPPPAAVSTSKRPSLGSVWPVTQNKQLQSRRRSHQFLSDGLKLDLASPRNSISEEENHAALIQQVANSFKPNISTQNEESLQPHIDDDVFKNSEIETGDKLKFQGGIGYSNLTKIPDSGKESTVSKLYEQETRGSKSSELTTAGQPFVSSADKAPSDSKFSRSIDSNGIHVLDETAGERTTSECLDKDNGLLHKGDDRRSSAADSEIEKAQVEMRLQKMPNDSTDPRDIRARIKQLNYKGDATSATPVSNGFKGCGTSKEECNDKSEYQAVGAEITDEDQEYESTTLEPLLRQLTETSDPFERCRIRNSIRQIRQDDESERLKKYPVSKTDLLPTRLSSDYSPSINTLDVTTGPSEDSYPIRSQAGVSNSIVHNTTDTDDREKSDPLHSSHVVNHRPSLAPTNSNTTDNLNTRRQNLNNENQLNNSNKEGSSQNSDNETTNFRQRLGPDKNNNNNNEDDVFVFPPHINNQENKDVKSNYTNTLVANYSEKSPVTKSFASSPVLEQAKARLRTRTHTLLSESGKRDPISKSPSYDPKTSRTHSDKGNVPHSPRDTETASDRYRELRRCILGEESPSQTISKPSKPLETTIENSHVFQPIEPEVVTNALQVTHSRFLDGSNTKTNVPLSSRSFTRNYSSSTVTIDSKKPPSPRLVRHQAFKLPGHSDDKTSLSTEGKSQISSPNSLLDKADSCASGSYPILTDSNNKLPSKRPECNKDFDRIEKLNTLPSNTPPRILPDTPIASNVTPSQQRKTQPDKSIPGSPSRIPVKVSSHQSSDSKSSTEYKPLDKRETLWQPDKPIVGSLVEKFSEFREELDKEETKLKTFSLRRTGSLNSGLRRPSPPKSTHNISYIDASSKTHPSESKVNKLTREWKELECKHIPRIIEPRKNFTKRASSNSFFHSKQNQAQSDSRKDDGEVPCDPKTVSEKDFITKSEAKSRESFQPRLSFDRKLTQNADVLEKKNDDSHDAIVSVKGGQKEKLCDPKPVGEEDLITKSEAQSRQFSLKTLSFDQESSLRADISDTESVEVKQIAAAQKESNNEPRLSDHPDTTNFVDTALPTKIHSIEDSHRGESQCKPESHSRRQRKIGIVHHGVVPPTVQEYVPDIKSLNSEPLASHETEVRRPSVGNSVGINNDSTEKASRRLRINDQTESLDEKKLYKAEAILLKARFPDTDEIHKAIKINLSTKPASERTKRFSVPAFGIHVSKTPSFSPDIESKSTKLNSFATSSPLTSPVPARRQSEIHNRKPAATMEEAFSNLLDDLDHFGVQEDSGSSSSEFDFSDSDSEIKAQPKSSSEKDTPLTFDDTSRTVHNKHGLNDENSVTLFKYGSDEVDNMTSQPNENQEKPLFDTNDEQNNNVLNRNTTHSFSQTKHNTSIEEYVAKDSEKDSQQNGSVTQQQNAPKHDPKEKDNGDEAVDVMMTSTSPRLKALTSLDNWPKEDSGIGLGLDESMMHSNKDDLKSRTTSTSPQPPSYYSASSSSSSSSSSPSPLSLQQQQQQQQHQSTSATTTTKTTTSPSSSAPQEAGEDDDIDSRKSTLVKNDPDPGHKGQSTNDRDVNGSSDIVVKESANMDQVLILPHHQQELEASLVPKKKTVNSNVVSDDNRNNNNNNSSSSNNNINNSHQTTTTTTATTTSRANKNNNNSSNDNNSSNHGTRTFDVNEEADGTYTVRAAAEDPTQNKVVTVRTKKQRTPSNANEELKDTIVERKIFSRTGSVVAEERDVIQTKKRLTHRGSHYYQRNAVTTKTLRNRNGEDIVEHGVSVEYDNTSVSQGHSWADKVTTKVVVGDENAPNDLKTKKVGNDSIDLATSGSSGYGTTNEESDVKNDCAEDKNASTTCSLLSTPSEDYSFLQESQRDIAIHEQHFEEYFNVDDGGNLENPNSLHIAGNHDENCATPEEELLRKVHSRRNSRRLSHQTGSETNRTDSGSYYTSDDYYDDDDIDDSEDDDSCDNRGGTFANRAGPIGCSGQDHTAALSGSHLRQSVRFQKSFLFLGSRVSPPEIVQTLKDVTVTEGKPIVLECRILAKPEPHVMWYKDDELVGESDEYVIRFDPEMGKATLLIGCSTLFHTAKFTCQGQNTAGNATTQCRALVKRRPTTRPVFESELSDVVVTEGHSTMLVCKVKEAASVSWYKDGIVQRNSSDFKQTFDGVAARLEIGEVFLDDVGRYTCVAKNDVGEEKTSCQLNVNACTSETTVVPMFLNKLPNPVVNDGETLELECDVIGSPEPSISWMKRGKPLDSGNNSFSTSYDGRVARLVVDALKPQDAGRYTCLAQNPAGRVSMDSNVTVQVKNKAPYFTEALQKEMSTKSGDVVVLKCEISGSPPPVILWRKNGILIGSGSSIVQSYNGRVARLEILGVTSQDGGIYECVGKNSVSEVTCSCLLSVTGSTATTPTSPPTTLSSDQSTPLPQISRRRTFKKLSEPRPKDVITAVLLRASSAPNGGGGGGGGVQRTQSFTPGSSSSSTALSPTSPSTPSPLSSSPLSPSRSNEVPSTLSGLPKTSTTSKVSSIVSSSSSSSSSSSPSSSPSTQITNQTPSFSVPKEQETHDTNNVIMAPQRPETLQVTRNSITISPKSRQSSLDHSKSVLSETLSKHIPATSSYTSLPPSSSSSQSSSTTSTPRSHPVGRSASMHVLRSRNSLNSQESASTNAPSQSPKPLQITLNSSTTTSHSNPLSGETTHDKNNSNLNNTHLSPSTSTIPGYRPVSPSFLNSPTKEKQSPSPSPLTVTSPERHSDDDDAKLAKTAHQSSNAPKTTGEKKDNNSTSSAADNELTKPHRSISTPSPSPLSSSSTSLSSPTSLPSNNNNNNKNNNNNNNNIASNACPPDNVPTRRDEPAQQHLPPPKVSTGRIVSPRVSELRAQFLKNDQNASSGPPKPISGGGIRRWHSLPPQEAKPRVIKRDTAASRDRTSDTNKPAIMPNYDQMNDEDELHKLMNKTDDFDERKKIRARLREIRDKQRDDMEARRKARDTGSQDAVKLKFQMQEDQKKLQLEGFAKQAVKTSTVTESKTGPAGETKTSTTTTTESSKTTPGGGTRTVIQKTTETTVQSKGLGASYGKPAEQTARELTEQIMKSTNAGGGTTGHITVKTESWNSNDGMVNRSQKSQSWGGGGGGGGTAKPSNPMDAFKKMDNAANPSPAKPNGLVAVSLAKRAANNMRKNAVAIKQEILYFCQMNTQEYENVQITNFSSSWNTGMAFCALIHHFYPDAFEFAKLNPKARRFNFTLAFDIAEQKADIAPLLEVDDMVKMKNPDWKCVFTYVQSIYRHLRDHENNKVMPCPVAPAEPAEQ